MTKFPHPFVTLFATRGRWYATFRQPGTRRWPLISMRRLGIFTSAGRRDWAMAKDLKLRTKWAEIRAEQELDPTETIRLREEWMRSGIAQA